MNTSKRNWLIVAAIVVAVAVLAAFELNHKPAAQYFTTKVERGDIHQVVQATGTINAVITVQVGSQVSGTISKLYVDFNSRVKKGQLIAQIDPALFQGAMLQAKADLGNARANEAAAKANLEKAKATAVQTKADYDRTVGLTKEGVMSQQQLDLAKANYETADAQVSAAQAQLVQAAAQTKQKEAAVSVAQTNLDYTTIHAPIDGTVVARNVDVGQTVAASLQAPTLFTIAQDLTKMQVYAQTDESDVGNIHLGQEATFNVDAFPGQTFKGRVSQIRMNATIVQNVVTYNTIVDFDNPQEKLFPGMTAYVTIPVADAVNAVKIPNGALRYKPDMKPDEIRALLKKAGIGGTGSGAAEGAGGGTEAAKAERPRSTPGGGTENAGAMRPPAAGAGRGPRMDVAVVWKLTPNKTIEPVQVRTGITDHTYTAAVQVLHGSLEPGDELVTGSAAAKGSGGPPGMGGGPRR